MSKQKWDDSSMDSEIYDIARGLYDSKVNIKRPPSAAQHSVYTTSFGGPPPCLSQVHAKEKKTRPYSAKGRITSEVVGKPRLPWRPFSGHAALNRPTFLADDNYDTNVNKKVQLININTASQEQGPLSDVTALPKVYHNRSLPKSLLSLSKWLTDDIPDDWPSCYQPQHSFVFLPCVNTGECDGLPGVPPVQQPEDSLIYNPAPQIKKYKPPKPRFKHFYDGEDKERKQCCHKGSGLNQVPSHAVGVIDDRYKGMRTVDIIRQEIQDLERLLEGIGNPTGSSVVVRYQHDINHLRNMLQTTLDGYELDDNTPRCLTPVAVCFQEDLIRYPDEHEQIFKTIKQRRDQCVQELADVEHEIMENDT